MPSAIVQSDGLVRQLDARAGEPIVVTSEDVKDVEKLARMLQDTRRELAELRRRWAPRELYFRDQAVTATNTTKIRLTHNFNGKVNWAVVRWDGSAAGSSYGIDEHADTDANTLVVVSSVAGTATIRVWEAG
jgi:hypothetical protein